MIKVGRRSEAQSENKSSVNKKLAAASVILVILIISGVVIYLNQNKNPLPANIKAQISYKTVYPAKASLIDNNGYQITSGQKSLTYALNTDNTQIVFIEQTAPASLGSGNQIYFPAIGIHPYAQFQSKLGPVALTKFYQAGSLTPNGQTAVLVAQGTMVTAHPNSNLTNAQWKALFNSLKITK